MSNEPLVVEKMHDVSSRDRRHRTADFELCLAVIDSQVPDDLDLHRVFDDDDPQEPGDLSLARDPPRFHMTRTPHLLQLINQVE